MSQERPTIAHAVQSYAEERIMRLEAYHQLVVRAR